MTLFNPPNNPTIFNVLGTVFFVLFPGQGSAQPPLIQVTMEYWAPYYSPDLAMVPQGALVQIINSTSSPHTITHESCRKSGPCAIDTGAIQPGEDYLIPSPPPGRYPYYCELHPIMRGEIVVTRQIPMVSQATAHD